MDRDIKAGGRGLPAPAQSVENESPNTPDRVRRKKTRPPTPVRASRLSREPIGRMPAMPLSAMAEHLEPQLSGPVRNSRKPNAVRSSADSPSPPGGVEQLMQAVQLAIDSRNWQRLDLLLGSMRDSAFRLDDNRLKSYPAVQKIIRSAPIDVLEAVRPAQSMQVLLALDLLEQGCDWHATDASGNTVATLIRQSMDRELRKVVFEEFPHLRERLQ